MRAASALVESLNPQALQAEQASLALPCRCTGGTLCGKENPATQRSGAAIPGLHSTWVGERILAMSRPWQQYITKFKIVDVFVHHRVGLILNLQEPGEHGGCGPGNLPSGFTYDPEVFTAAGIGFSNLGWRDMGVPSLDLMMDIVQVMEHVTTVQQRKVAVHSHAGLGRTGLAIACFLVWSGEHSARAAVATIRKLRPGSLETSQQVAFVTMFEKYLHHLKCVFKAQASTLVSPASSQPSSSGGYQAPGPGSGPFGPSATGVQVKVDTMGIQTETYPNGLLIVRAAGRAAGKNGNQGTGRQAARGSKQGSMDYEPGVDKTQPWSARFRSANQVPDVPCTYEEALMRQVRLLHGVERYNYLHLHRLLKHAVFAVINAAVAHYWHAPRPLGDQWQVQVQWQHAHTLPPLNSYTGGIGSAAPLPAPPASFAHAVCMFITDAWRSDDTDQAGIDPPELVAMAQSPVFRPFVGNAVSSRALAAGLAAVRHAVNNQQLEVLSSVPLAVVLVAIEEFFQQFDHHVPSLSLKALEHMCETYIQLPYDPTPGVPEELQVRAAASAIISPLPAADQELLLLLAALLRHILRASGHGCEAEAAKICSWLARLLLGEFDSKQAVEEALCSYLWCLMRNDIVYSALIISKSARLSGAGGVGEPGSQGMPGMVWMSAHAGGESSSLARGQWSAGAGQAQAARSEAALLKLAAKSVPGMTWLWPGGSQGPTSAGAQRAAHTSGNSNDYELMVSTLPSHHPLRMELQADHARLYEQGLPPGEHKGSAEGVRRYVHHVWL